VFQAKIGELCEIETRDLIVLEEHISLNRQRLLKTYNKVDLMCIVSTLLFGLVLKFLVTTFRSVVSQALEVDVYVILMYLHLKKRAQDIITRLYTLPEGH
jgi:hypothetical protein